MEIYQLELFLAVAQTGNLTRAAQDRGMSPAALSQQLSRLSSELGVALFEKNGRGIRLTSQGEAAFARARRVLDEVEGLRSSIGGGAERDRQPFHLATGATTLIHALQPALKGLKSLYPEAQIHVTVANTEEMVPGLVSGRFDLAIISLPLAEERIVARPLYDEELLLLRPSRKPLKGWGVGEIGVEELGEEPFLLYQPGSNMRELIDRRLHELGYVPKVTTEASDTEVLVRLVEAGYGQSILPEYALRRTPRNFRVYRLRGVKIVRHQAIAMARGRQTRQLREAVANYLAAVLSSETIVSKK